MIRNIMGGFAIAAAPKAALALVGGTDIHFNKKAEPGRIHVACVGDSLTNGALIPGCFWRSYPAQLGRMLGKKYQVANFGLNDRTLQRTAHMPYEFEKDYGDSLEFKPDYLIIMLGTNDTKDKNWISEDAFVDQYRRFLLNYRSITGEPKIVLCIPPWAKNTSYWLQSFTNDTVSERLPQVARAVRRVADELKLPVLDLYSLTKGKTYLYSYDALHLNAKGAAFVAEKVRDYITDNVV